MAVIMFNAECQIALNLVSAVGGRLVSPRTCLLIRGLKLNSMQGWRSAITQTGGMPGAALFSKTISALRRSRSPSFPFSQGNGVCGNSESNESASKVSPHNHLIFITKAFVARFSLVASPPEKQNYFQPRRCTHLLIIRFVVVVVRGGRYNLILNNA